MDLILNTAVAGDAREAVRATVPGSIDLVILDPNYEDWANLVATGFLEEVVATLKPSGNIICFTKQPFDVELRNAATQWFRREIIWSFSNGGAWVSKKMPLVSFQKLYWLAGSKDFFFEPRTGLSYSASTKAVKRGVKVFGGYREEGKDFVPSDEGTWIRDHYHFNKPHNARVFAKPEELIRILLRCFCPSGGTILDPFFGSGVTGIQARQLGMNFYGIEIDEEAVNNFNAEQSALLF